MQRFLVGSTQALGENKPSRSIHIHVEMIDYFLRRYREEIIKRKELDIEAGLSELERDLRNTEERMELCYAAD